MKSVKREVWKLLMLLKISNGVAFGRTVKYVNRAQTADQQDPSLSKVRHQLQIPVYIP